MLTMPYSRMSRRITVPVGGNLGTSRLHFCKYVFSHLQCRIVSHVALKGRVRTYIHTSSLIVGFAGPHTHKRQVGTQSYVPKLSLPNGSRDLGGIAKNILENLPCSRIKKKPKPFSRYAPCGWSDELMQARDASWSHRGVRRSPNRGWLGRTVPKSRNPTVQSHQEGTLPSSSSFLPFASLPFLLFSFLGVHRTLREWDDTSASKGCAVKSRAGQAASQIHPGKGRRRP